MAIERGLAAVMQSGKKHSEMYQLLCDLYPLHRTINSDDFEKSIEMIGRFIGKGYEIRSYEPGTRAFTWSVPYRYCVDEAYIEHDGKRYADFSENNLSLVSYSVPIDKTLTYEELRPHVYTSASMPDEIPWIFKYYEKDWGFCLRHNEWISLDKKGTFRAVIKSRFEKKPFVLGEFFIPGTTREEILWVSDVCHPNQVNDSISGAVVAAQIARELKEKYRGRYGLRFLFLPETIGSVVWFSKNENKIPSIKYGMFCEMVGNDNRFLLKNSLRGDTLIDKAAAHVLARHEKHGKTEIIPFKQMAPGNDEKVMNSIGINIPSISITRWPYPEYHTTADNPSLIDPANLEETKSAALQLLHILNADRYPVYLSKGPIFLSGYGLWVRHEENPNLNRALQWMLFLLDGRHSVLQIADELQLDFETVHTYLLRLEENGLIRWSTAPVSNGS